MISTSCFDNIQKDATELLITIGNEELRRKFVGSIIELAAKELAQKATEEMLTEIIERISPEAIANMAIAHAGAKINETLNKKMPDTVRHEYHEQPAQIYQRGIFGGISRIR